MVGGTAPRALPLEVRGRPLAPLTLVYDDRCGTCRGIAAAIGRRDRGARVRLVPRSDHAAVALLGLGAVDDVLLVDGAGDVRRGLAVVAPLLAVLPRWRYLAPLLRLRPFAGLVALGWLLLRQLRHER
jgi:predicted DCC family thiol-disulfide oxidoreductase YuxK